MLGPFVVFINGYPGSGKYTIARALARKSDTHFVVVDSHHVNNTIFSVLDTTAPMPAEAWHYIAGVREHVLHAIEELAPPSWSFVFTNYRAERIVEHVAAVERLRAVADRRGSQFVSVTLHCEPGELKRRIANRDRADRLKIVDPARLDAYFGTELVRPDAAITIELDVTELAPEDAAARILARLED